MDQSLGFKFPWKNVPLKFLFIYDLWSIALCIQVNDQIVETAGDLFECDAVEKLFSSYLRDVSLCLKDTSGINCENWGNLKLATALIVIFGPEEDDNDFRKVIILTILYVFSVAHIAFRGRLYLT